LDPLVILQKLSRIWTGLPEQIRRLPVLLVILVAGLLVARSYLVPKDFGKYGHYRATALVQAANLDIHYAGHQVCEDCHDEEVALKAQGYHKGLACEICHGPAFAHTEDPDVGQLRAPRERGYCPLCHEYLPSRPTGFPQIVTASHNPRKPCITCHNPHDPKPLHTPEECEACHATIARTKALSDHVYVACTVCHNAPEEHKINPRRFVPSRPDTREFCGTCHARGADTPVEAKTVDMSTHGGRYVCWQCHYPHLPEVR
jgi:hypothetical protein